MSADWQVGDFDAADLAMQIEGFFSEAADNPCTCGSDPEAWCRYCAAWAEAHRKTERLLQDELGE